MAGNSLIVEHRGVYFGKQTDYAAELKKELGRICGLTFHNVFSGNELIEECYTYEPMLILAELDTKTIGELLSIYKINKYRQSVSIGLVYQENDSMRRYSDENVVTDITQKTNDPHADALAVARIYKFNMKYGVNIKTVTKHMPIVTDLVWNDPSLDEKEQRKAISDKLVKLGIRRGLSGHKYLIAALVIQSAVHTSPDMGRIYNNVAEYYDVTPKSVEKAIRYAIEKAWTEGDIDYQHFIFGMSIDEDKGKPTNAEFIARLAIDF